MSYYHHYYHQPSPQYRCSTCGRRCGANGHAGCGNAECINDLPGLFLPIMVGLMWGAASILVWPFSLLAGNWLWNGWCVFGVVAVGLTLLLAILGGVASHSAKINHKQDSDALFKIIAEGMKSGKTADVLRREMDEYYNGK